MEKTPDGLDQHSPGAKVDAGKNRLNLVLGGFPRALMGVGEVGTFGANKYTEDGWKQVVNGEGRYADAMLRHYFKFKKGEVVDDDSGLPHLAHLAWNALAILELAMVNDEIDKKHLTETFHAIDREPYVTYVDEPIVGSGDVCAKIKDPVGFSTNWLSSSQL